MGMTDHATNYFGINEQKAMPSSTIKDNIRFDLLRCMCVNSYSLCGDDQKLSYLEFYGNIIRNYHG